MRYEEAVLLCPHCGKVPILQPEHREWVVENLPVGDNAHQMTYRFTDIYGNQYWTESIGD